MLFQGNYRLVPADTCYFCPIRFYLNNAINYINHNFLIFDFVKLQCSPLQMQSSNVDFPTPFGPAIITI
jgi:hypothetical protein